MKSIPAFTALIVGLVFCRDVLAQDVPALQKAVQAFARTSSPPRFEYALVDLTGSGKSDAIVLMQNSAYCGSGGCTMVIFKAAGTGFEKLSSSTVTSEPIQVLPEVRYGWRTLVVTARGVGPVVMRFDGMRYPLNPSLQIKVGSAQLGEAKTLKLQDCACGD